MIKEHDQQAKMKATPRKLAYVDFDKEAPARGEVAVGSAEMVRPSQGDKGYVRPAWSRQIEEVVVSRILAHLVKDIRQNNQRNGNHERSDEPIILEGVIEGNQVRRILVDGGGSLEIVYEHCFRNLDINIRSRLRRCKAPMIEGGAVAPTRRANVQDKGTSNLKNKKLVYDDGGHIDNQLQAVTGRHSMGKHRDDDGNGLSQSKRTKHGNTLRGSSNKKKKISSEEVLCLRSASRRDARCKRRGNAQPKQEASRKTYPNTKGLEVVSRTSRLCEQRYERLACFHGFTKVPDHTSSKNFKLQSRGVNRIGNHKVKISQSGSRVGIKTRPSVEETSTGKKEKAASNAPRA
nr:reverse transcriptase domain-containing protein [Tanacetum cinerariifolium]